MKLFEVPKSKQVGVVGLILLLSSLIFSVSTVTTARAAGTITVCPSGCGVYSGGTGLQKAFTDANNGDTIIINPGVYENPFSILKVSQKDWRQCPGGANSDYGTSFLIQGKSNLTIKGQDGKSADQIVILGGQQVIDPLSGQLNGAVHALTINGSTNINISNVSIFSNGGLWNNGVADGALNVVGSTGSIKNSIISGNKTSSNPLYPFTNSEIDQEGIALFGPGTDFEIANNIIANNFHTGVMLEHGARGVVKGNLITRNGYESGRVDIGHGITSFHESDATSCFNGNIKLKAWNNVITDNSGVGILVRGAFVGSDNKIGIAHNSIFNNQVGIRIGPLESWGNGTSFSGGASALVANNMLLGNQYSGVKVVVPPLRGMSIDSSSQINIYNNVGYQNKPGADFVPAQSIPDPSNPSHLLIELRNNLFDTNPVRSSYFEIYGLPLKDAGWTYPGAANQWPDISSYENFNNAAVFNKASLTQICPTYGTAAQRLGALDYAIRCSY